VVVAEGVESSVHVDFLREHGCAQGQGFYLGRPVPPQMLGRDRMRVTTGAGFAPIS
jgi:EAL domain-containing protein (putative c-di-GMP-specific phosphodiesterase class I)